MSRYTIPYRELPPPVHPAGGVLRRIGKVFGWAFALSGLALVCAAFSR